MKLFFYILSITVLISMTLGTSSCKKNTVLSSGHLDFSADTVIFDTVFTTIGSTTKNFKLYNNNNSVLVIDEIELMGGENSAYRINVDGVSGVSHSDISVQANDSLFVFVEVTLDANNTNNPLVIEDSIRFRTNGQDQYVVLAAWGQDAYFHYSDSDNTGIWPNDKPHVVYGFAGVDEGESLTIQAGTQVFLHKRSYLFIYKSTLDIQGTYGNEVVFQGDRLEEEYQDVSGQYYGIYFREALPSSIDYAIIKNGTAGVHIDSEDPTNGSTPTLTMTNTRIENCASYGVFIFNGGHVSGENNIVAKNGIHSMLVLGGGDFNFKNCNFIGYSNGEGSSPALGINNYYENQDGVVHHEQILGTMDNCVIYGNLEQEIAIDTITNPIFPVDIEFRNNLIRSETEPEAIDPFYSSTYLNIFNIDPEFNNIEENYYKFSLVSPLHNAGSNALMSIQGIDGTMRSSTPDIGAHEIN